MTVNGKKMQPGVSFLTNGEALINLWAPNAQKVSVILKDNNENMPLTLLDRGYWTLTTDKIKPNEKYKFLLDDKKELPDPASLSQPDGVHGASQAINLNEFIQRGNAWRNIPLQEYIIYELHTGTFTTEGTFKAIESKLVYLKELGITAIEIMPVAQFPGGRNWGYDGVFPYAVQNTYGGAEGLVKLIDACHENGLAVILDVVYNHVGPEGNYFNDFGPYFTDKYHTPWGNAINFDDAQCDEVRNYFINNVLMWFRDFNVDALRMDAVHAIKDFSPKHILQEMKEAVNSLTQETGRTHYLIIEFDLNDSRFIEPIEKGGYGMDAQWIDEFHHALRVTAGEEPNGYYSDFNGITHLAKAYQDAYVYDGIYSPQRQKTFGTKAIHNPGQQFVVFSQNHDHVGNRMLGERSSTLFSFEMQKLMAGAVLISPYLPMLFMGEEWSEQNPFLYFVSHTDDDLIQAVRKGRKEEFKSFHTDGEAPDPQAEDTFTRSKLSWDNLNNPKHQTMLAYYKSLIGIRKQLPALFTLNRHQMEVTCNKEQQTLLLHRWQGAQHVYIFMNFSKQQEPLTLPTDHGQLRQLFNSASAAFGTKEDRAAHPNTIQPESLILFIN